MTKKHRFPPDIVAAIHQSKVLGVRAGTGPHRIIGIWAVVVEDRVFVRSWSVKPNGWYRTFRKEPRGTIAIGGQELAARAVGLALTVPVFTYFAHTVARAAQGQRSGLVIQLAAALLLLFLITFVPRLWQARKRKEKYRLALERRKGRRGGA